MKDVVHSSGLVLVSVQFPELLDADLLAWKEWLHTELRAFAAQQPDGLVIAPYYVDQRQVGEPPPPGGAQAAEAGYGVIAATRRGDDGPAHNSPQQPR